MCPTKYCCQVISTRQEWWVVQGLYLFSGTNFKDYSSPLSDFLGPKFHLWPFHSQDFNINSPYGLCTFHIMYILKTLLLNQADFLDFPRPVVFFQDFPVLENVKIKFHSFPGFPRPIQTLVVQSIIVNHKINNIKDNNNIVFSFQCLSRYYVYKIKDERYKMKMISVL